MVSLADVFANTLGINIWEIVKVFYIAFLLLYVIFAGIIVRQIRLMANTVTGALTSFIRIAAYIHFTVALLVFFLAFFVLRT